ncbi:MAG: hypothetical protein ACRC6X_00085 [Culicoidibacterales bacterium]
MATHLSHDPGGTEKIGIDLLNIPHLFLHIDNKIKQFSSCLTEYRKILRELEAFQDWKDKAKIEYISYIRKDIEVLDKTLIFYEHCRKYLEQALQAYIDADQKAKKIIDQRMVK